MRNIPSNLWGMLKRTGLRCVFPAQSVAFNLFIAFFPFLLLVVSLLTLLLGPDRAIQEILVRIRLLLPQGSIHMVADYLVGRDATPWRWIVAGLIGTLLLGTQAMNALRQGFRTAHGEITHPPFWGEQRRSLVMLLVTIGPWVGVSVLFISGRRIRGRLIEWLGLPEALNQMYTVLYVVLALLAAVGTLAVVYRLGREGYKNWHEVWPGAMVATLLWWGVNFGFGLYVRYLPYQVVFGGLAAVIGLLIWMYLSALVVLMGAAYNAEARGVPLWKREW